MRSPAIPNEYTQHDKNRQQTCEQHRDQAQNAWERKNLTMLYEVLRVILVGAILAFFPRASDALIPNINAEFGISRTQASSHGHTFCSYPTRRPSHIVFLGYEQRLFLYNTQGRLGSR